MKMKHHIQIIIGCGLISVGLICSVVGIACGGLDYEKYLKTMNLEDRVDTPTEHFSSVLIDTESAEVTVKTGDSLSIAASAVETDGYSVTVENDMLQVKQQRTDGNITLGFEPQAKIEITLLETDYLSLAAAIDFGDCIVQGVAVSTLSLQTDSGDCTISDCTAASCTITVDYGDCTLSDTAIDGTAMVTLDCGDLEIENTTIQKGLKLESDYGDVAASGVDFGYLEAKLSCGDLTLESCNGSQDTGNSTLYADYGDMVCTNTVLYDAEFQLDKGDLMLSGSALYGTSLIQMELGDLEINLLGTASDYRMITAAYWDSSEELDQEENNIILDVDETTYDVEITYVE